MTELSSSNDFNLSASRMINAMRVSRSGAQQFMHGAFVEPHQDGGITIVSTDGCAMLVQHDLEGFAPRAAILRVTPPECSRQDDEEGDSWHWCNARLIIDGSSATKVQAGRVHWGDSAIAGTHMIVEEIEAEIPDWRLIFNVKIPPSKFKKGQSDGIQLPLLDALAGWTRHLRLQSLGESRPFIVHFEEDPHAVGVLAPSTMSWKMPERSADLLSRLSVSLPQKNAHAEADFERARIIELIQTFPRGAEGPADAMQREQWLLENIVAQIKREARNG